MSIIAANNGGAHFEPIPAGNYVARCYQMIHIGTVEENVMGTLKKMNKVRIGFELPTETKVFKEENGEQPCVISEEFTLSLHEKATLRKYLESWRGKKFTEEEAKGFDIEALIGKTCMINVIHNEAKNGNTYAKIGSISPMPKGLECPKQVNGTFVLSYDNFDSDKFETLPAFIKDKMAKSSEYNSLGKPAPQKAQVKEEEEEGLPF